jgi:hypothetical protein
VAVGRSQDPHPSRLVPGQTPECASVRICPLSPREQVPRRPWSRKQAAAVLATSERGFDFVEVLAAVVGPDSVERAVGVER